MGGIDWSRFLAYYLFTILIETPMLLAILSRRHPLRRRLVAGVWLTACTYPIVFIVLPEIFDITDDRIRYLIVAETFAPLAECAIFWFAFGQAEPRSRGALVQDMIAIIVANLASFGFGEVANHYGWLQRLGI